MAKKKDEARERIRQHIPDEAVEHARKARKEMYKSFEALFPPEFLARRRAARKEMLMAARSMINHAIERIDERETI
ncbi:MAG: hypothetical protein DWQ07_08695 [Chloroflexi bacterium]|nr:MAG: hypothetical protein DWQ07_08695 [Chloroflexota bacterium]MBL1193210.1 hypothetical protein [Chloroflexota bacterium]NOH10504.1 hypothetical protein [Chloroflexota bacterium]